MEINQLLGYPHLWKPPFVSMCSKTLKDQTFHCASPAVLVIRHRHLQPIFSQHKQVIDIPSNFSINPKTLGICWTEYHWISRINQNLGMVKIGFTSWFSSSNRLYWFLKLIQRKQMAKRHNPSWGYKPVGSSTHLCTFSSNKKTCC